MREPGSIEYTVPPEKVTVRDIAVMTVLGFIGFHALIFGTIHLCKYPMWLIDLVG